MKDAWHTINSISADATLRVRVSELEAAMREAEEALGFYADSYQYGEGNGLSWEHCEWKLIGADRGVRAREALTTIRKAKT